MKTLTFIKTAAALLAVVFMVSACNDRNEPGARFPESYLQFVNAFPNDRPLGVKTERGWVNPEPLHYGVYLRYQAFLPGDRQISVGFSGTNDAIADTTAELRDSMSYTLMVNSSDSVAHLLLAEDRTPTDFDAGKAYIRFFNIADRAPQATVRLSGSGDPTTPITGRSRDNQASVTANQGFIAVDQGTYSVALIGADGSVIAERDPQAGQGGSVEMRAGHYYTILSRGIYQNQNFPMRVGVVDHRAW